jgi:hypothetical protein
METLSNFDVTLHVIVLNKDGLYYCLVHYLYPGICRHTLVYTRSQEEYYTAVMIVCLALLECLIHINIMHCCTL